MSGSIVTLTLLSGEVFLYIFITNIKVTVTSEVKNSETGWKAGLEDVSGYVFLTMMSDTFECF